jgi:AP-1 complex subunit beta-1
MLMDGNAIVVSNALVALAEIGILTGNNILIIGKKNLKRILIALNEASEWGQVYILDCLLSYTPKKASSAEDIIENIIPRLTHANPAVVMSAIKVILKLLNKVENEEKLKIFYKKLSNSLVTVMNSGHELQYLLLR